MSRYICIYETCVCVGVDMSGVVVCLYVWRWLMLLSDAVMIKPEILLKYDIEPDEYDLTVCVYE